VLSGELHTNDPKIDSLKWKKLNEIKVENFLPTTKFFLEKIKVLGLEKICELHKL
jgi:hypothetical protein